MSDQHRDVLEDQPEKEERNYDAGDAESRPEVTEGRMKFDTAAAEHVVLDVAVVGIVAYRRQTVLCRPEFTVIDAYTGTEPIPTYGEKCNARGQFRASAEQQRATSTDLCD